MTAKILLLNTALVALMLIVKPAGTLACDITVSHYKQVPASRDGIGKVYMGREISHVMGHLGAGWLERPQREREERTDLLLDSLKPEPMT